MSAKKRRLPVVFCWHMHQPDYRGPEGGDYQLPWVYLHGIKDYVDMAAHLEANPKARAVVNFVPVLLEQIADYAAQIRRWLDTGERIGDPLLAALAGPGVPEDCYERHAVVRACRKANKTHLIDRFGHFHDLVKLSALGDEHPHYCEYYSEQYFVDLLVWYHIAWMGETVRDKDARLKALMEKSREFNQDDRRMLVTLIGELMDAIVPRYKRLAEQGRVELSVTPYAHPIVPLLIDFETAREAIPDAALPESEGYPEGEDRAVWHVERGLEVFEEFFGFRPKGCWPAEGAVSTEGLELLHGSGFRWVASGQQVLHNTLQQQREDELPLQWPHRPYRIGDSRSCVFFRDEGLSDLIGFTYSDWHAEDAVNNFVSHLETIHANTEEIPEAVAAIIMDGENAWEYYPGNGSYFLKALYAKLADHPLIELTTFSTFLDTVPCPKESLTGVVTGSWVYGTLSTWIGDPDKNRAWDMLVEAKETFDRVIASGRLSDEERDDAEQQLAICEGSDWFWWFGDYNPSDTVSDFESLYRRQLELLYRILKETPPAYLEEVFAHGSGEPAKGGVMRQVH
ncbi:MAG: glycoside hydrolase family 57 protein [Pseudomonadota bacterium]